MNTLKTNIISAILIISIFTVTVVGLSAYNTGLNNYLSIGVLDTLEDTMAQQRFNVYSKIIADQDLLKNLAISIRYLKEDDKAPDLIKEIVNNSNFENLILADVSGNGISDTKQRVDISQQPYFNAVLNGKSVIVGPVPSLLRSVNIIGSVVPILDTNNNVKAIAVGSYEDSNLEKLLFESFKGQGYSVITDSKGNIITHSKSDHFILNNIIDNNNLFSGFSKIEFVNYDDLAAIKENINQNKSGSSIWEIDGKERYMTYTPIGINDWYLFEVATQEVVLQQSNHIVHKSILMALGIIIMFLLLCYHIYNIEQKKQKTLKKYSNTLEYLAFYNSITKLPNLTKFKIDISDIVARNQQESFHIVRFDINQFRALNDLYGMQGGDNALKAIANAGNKLSQENSNIVFGHISTDIFIFAAPALIVDEMQPEFSKLERLFYKEFYNLNNTKHNIPCTFGMFADFKYGMDINEAIEKAIIAHRNAKARGKKLSVYNEDFKRKLLLEYEINNIKECALYNNQFHMYLQPKFSLFDESIIGAEALVRWINPEGKIISPADFIPLFEKSGFVTQIDFLMLKKACMFLQQLKSLKLKLIPISVNFSRIHLSNEKFVTTIKNMVDSYDIEPNLIEIELTETTAFDREFELTTILYELKSHGFSVSMDDFGSGYSSLGLLKNMPFDTIKIDKSFFDISQDGERAKDIITSIMTLTKKLGISTIAEGVETKEMCDFLKESGCFAVQGYYFARPMQSEKLIELLKK